jgi:hypothetical protein
VLGFGLVSFGALFGLRNWSHSIDGSFASSGTVMLAALPTILGIQLLLAFLSFDIGNQPKEALWPRLRFKSFK